MKGVYVIDMSDESMFVCIASSYDSAKAITERTLQHVLNITTGVCPMNSYHYYPTLPIENDLEAELRVFKTMKSKFFSAQVYSQLPTLEIVAKQTWTKETCIAHVDSIDSMADESGGSTGFDNGGGPILDANSKVSDSMFSLSL